MKSTDEQRVDKILENAEELLKYIAENNLTREDILNKRPLQWLITTPLYNIGEQAYNISDNYKEKHSTIPWRKMAGLRHRLVHNYDGINWNMIVDVVFIDLPELINMLNEQC